MNGKPGAADAAALASAHLDAVLAAGTEHSLQRLQEAAHALRDRTDAVCAVTRRREQQHVC